MDYESNEVNEIDSTVGTISLCHSADNRDVQLACPDDVDAYQVAALFHDFLLAMGFYPDTVSEIVPEWILHRVAGFESSSDTQYIKELTNLLRDLQVENQNLRNALEQYAVKTTAGDSSVIRDTQYDTRETAKSVVPECYCPLCRER